MPALSRYELAAQGDVRFEQLSGGQQARLLILLLELSGATLLLRIVFDQYLPDELGAAQQRKKQKKPARAVDDVDDSANEQPGDEITRELARRQIGRCQHRLHRMPVFMRIDHRLVGEQPVTEKHRKQERGAGIGSEFAHERPAQ